MATVVYQGFQSYFESQQHFEPRTLRLRLSSPNNPLLTTPLRSHFIESSSITPQDNTSATTNAASLSSSGPNSDTNSGSWSRSNSSSDGKEKKTLLPYDLRSHSSRKTLSDESLALCTESLGSETGSDVINDQDLFAASSELQIVETRTSTTSRSSQQDRKRNAMDSLPPPLTSMRGFDCIQVKSHRENGKLVMTATKPPPRDRCLQDRSNGCVRLAFLIDSDEHIETETREEEEEEKEEETIEMERDNEEDIPEHKEEIEVMGIEKIQRSKRCHQGDRENRGFRNWESFCVATS